MPDYKTGFIIIDPRIISGIFVKSHKSLRQISGAAWIESGNMMEAVSELEFSKGRSGDRVIDRNNSNANDRTILARIADMDRTAVRDCLDSYGSLVWGLALRFTESPAQAEALTEEIFDDIWRYRPSDLNSRTVEKNVIAAIALRRLIKRKRVCQ